MTIKVSYYQFLLSKGVPKDRAGEVAARIDAKLMTRQSLTPAEAALSSAFLKRSGANRSAEKKLELRVWGDPHESAGGGTVWNLAAKGTGHTTVWPAKWKAFSFDGKSTDAVTDQQIRDLATQVAEAVASDPEWRYVPVRRFAT